VAAARAEAVLAAKIEAADGRLEDLRSRIDEAAAQTEAVLAAEAEAADGRAGELREHIDGSIRRAEAVLAAEAEAVDGRFGELRSQVEGAAAHIAAELDRTAREGEEKAAAAAAAVFEKWNRALETAGAKVRETLTDLETALAEREKHLSAELGGQEKRLEDLKTHIDRSISELEGSLAQAAEKAGEQALAEADRKLEEYRTVQLSQYRVLESLADDTARLDAELRAYMQETENRVREDFVLFEREAAQGRSALAADFAASAGALRTEMDKVEKGLTALKSRAYENVSDKLKIFEDDFVEDLAERGRNIDHRLEEWQAGMDARLGLLADESAVDRKALEQTFTEHFKARLQEHHEKLIADLEHLKAETAAFEEGIRDEMGQADQSLESFRDQLDRDLREARDTARVSAKAEIGRYGLSMAEALKQSQRELETSLKALSDRVEGRSGEITASLDAVRRETEEWQSKFSAQLREADATVDEGRRRARELAVESDERLSAVRALIQEIHAEAALHRTELFSHTEEQARSLDTAIKDADRRLKEFVSQTKLFDKADELKRELEHRIEDLRAEIDLLDQRRTEAAELEAQFAKIKRLEDDVNSKMTRFLSEKRRIELMEADFGRLLQTSQAVEEKLNEVSASDDILQAVQVQIRQLNDALKDVEEKYQRIEKKNQTLEATNSGIDRNFKALQETETAIRHFREDLDRLSAGLDPIRSSIDRLSQSSEKAQEASEKLSTLDLTLKDIEGRIDSMQVAREWLASAETRLEELNRNAQEQVRIMGSLLKEERGKAGSQSKGAPAMAKRENIISLHRQGWKVDEIARSLKLSKGEVELVLEIGVKD
jgi:chromosome segregation ATPase